MQQLNATPLLCAFHTSGFPNKKVNVCMSLNLFTFKTGAAGHLLTLTYLFIDYQLLSIIS